MFSDVNEKDSNYAFKIMVCLEDKTWDMIYIYYSGTNPQEITREQLSIWLESIGGFNYGTPIVATWMYSIIDAETAWNEQYPDLIDASILEFDVMESVEPVPAAAFY